MFSKRLLLSIYHHLTEYCVGFAFQFWGNLGVILKLSLTWRAVAANFILQILKKRRFMKNQFIVLSMFVLSFSACMDSGPLSSSALEKDSSQAQVKTLSEARQAVLEYKASLGTKFYGAAYKAEPSNPEYAYMASALYFASEGKKADKQGEQVLEKIKPNKVLVGLKEFQKSLMPMVNVFAQSYRLLSTGLSTPFDPLSLGTRAPYYDNTKTEEVFLDRVALFDFSSDVLGQWTLMSFFSAINFKTVEVFDKKLEALRKEVFASTPECKSKEGEKKAVCKNKLINAGLDLLLTSKDPKVVSLFTLSKPNRERVAKVFKAFQKNALTAKEMLKDRPVLSEMLKDRLSVAPDNTVYFAEADKFNDKDFKCLFEQCELDFYVSEGEKRKVVMDLPAFFKNPPADLRKFFPKSMNFALSDVNEFLRSVQLVDATFGGLFPNGDLVEKAIGSNDSESVAMFFAIMTAWAHPDSWTGE